MKDLADLSGATIYSVRHYLEVLQTSGQIRHVGPTKAGHWEILEANAADPTEAERAGV
jgi:FaeA-like protein